jgi:iron(III) transport system substrate-binding protein
MTLSRRAFLAATSFTASAVAFGGNPAVAQAFDEHSLLEAAKKEGKLTLYNGTNFAVAKDVAQRFEKKYGFAVQVLDGRASEIRERIRAEQASGRYLADLTYSGLTTVTKQSREGTFQDMGEIPDTANLDSSLESSKVLIPNMMGTFAILVNRALVKPDDEPKSWPDLLDPKWKGKILSDDPRALGAGNVWFEVLFNTYGQQFHDKMAEQKPVFSRAFAENQRRLARGEYAIYLPFNVSEYIKIRELPVKLILPSDGLPYVPFALALLKNAPNPNKARLFANFTLEPEVQIVFGEQGFRPAVKGMSAKIPGDLREIAEHRLLGTTSVDKQDAMLALANNIYR